MVHFIKLLILKNEYFWTVGTSRSFRWSSSLALPRLRAPFSACCHTLCHLCCALSSFSHCPVPSTLQLLLTRYSLLTISSFFFMLWWFFKKFILFCSCFWPQSFHSSSVGRFCRCWWASSCTMTSQSATSLKACRWADATTWLYTTFWFLCLCWIVLLCWERYACSCTVCPVGALPFTASQCALLWEKGVSGLCTEVEPARRGNGPPAALFHEVMNFSSSLESEGVQDGKNNNASQYMCIQRCGVYDKVAIKHWHHKY